MTVRSGDHERLQKVLARAGLASRREIEGWIRAGRLTVNGQPATLGVRVSAQDQVRLDGRLLRQRQAGGAARVFLCHRSPGEPLQQPLAEGQSRAIQAGSDASTRLTVLERLPRRAGRRFIAVSPMPRIDGGLELVTSDGELATRLQRTVHRLTAEFSIRVRGELGTVQMQAVLDGQLDSGRKLSVTGCEGAGGEGSNRWYALSVRGASGKEVRQLFERQGLLVSRVLRTRLGPLSLERQLSRGQHRELSADELESLAAADPADS